MAEASKAKAAATPKAATAAKAPARKKAVTELFIQWGEHELDCTGLEDRVKADFKTRSRAAVRTCRIYIKPEEGKAYYVVNDETGSIEI